MSRRAPHTPESIVEGIASTGFVLEHFVTTRFREQKWDVIPSRYYVDDLDGTARELDLIAYKVDQLHDFQVVSSVLVACKRERENAWALMSRPRPLKDANHDWEPVHYWCNAEPLASQLRGLGLEFKKSYLAEVEAAVPSLCTVERDVFATQVVAPPGVNQPAGLHAQSSAKAAKARNDGPIHSAITGLLQALDYEMNALPSRIIKERRVYQFSLVVVVDAPLFEVRFNDEERTAEPVDRLVHLARYMVRKRHFSAQVHFVTRAALDALIRDLSAQAGVNATFFARQFDKTFHPPETTAEAYQYLANRMKAGILSRAKAVLSNLGVVPDQAFLSLTFQKASGKLEIGVDAIEDDAIETLNSDKALRDYTAKQLKDVARYDGPFEFVFDMQF